MRALARMILATGTMLVSAPVQAQTYDPKYPVCMHAYGGQGDYIDCSYTSLAQCNATASGRGAQCVLNPFSPRPPDGRFERRAVR